MKYPRYVGEDMISKTKKLFNHIKQTQGTEEAFLFKKLSLVAAYGEMYIEKISYHEFIGEFEKYLNDPNSRWRTYSFSRNGCIEPLVSEFWGIGCTNGTAFHITHQHIAQDTIEQLEKAIIEELKRKDYTPSHEVDSAYEDYCNELIEEYETRRSKQNHRTL